MAFTSTIEKKMTLSLWLVIALVASILATCDSQDGELSNNNNNVNNIKNNKQYQTEGKYSILYW
jgi:hypothetical protein